MVPEDVGFKSLELVCYLVRQRGIKVTDGMKVTKAWIRQMGSITTIRILQSGSERCGVVAVKMKGGGHEPRNAGGLKKLQKPARAMPSTSTNTCVLHHEENPSPSLGWFHQVLAVGPSLSGDRAAIDPSAFMPGASAQVRVVAQACTVVSRGPIRGLFGRAK